MKLSELENHTEKIIDYLIGKEAIYKENKIAMHVSIEDINLNVNFVNVKLKRHNTPAFYYLNVENKNFSVSGKCFISKSIISCSMPWSINIIDNIDSFKNSILKVNHNEPLLDEYSTENGDKIIDALNYHYTNIMVLKLIEEEYKSTESVEILKLINGIFFQSQDHFIKWPKKSLNFMPDTVRDKKFFEYSTNQINQLKEAGITPDNRNNGPAIMSFLLAGGKRPKRAFSNKSWSIHHIYDGKFPFPGLIETTHAVKHPYCFAESAGLVALHPVADGLADESPYFSWLLRISAYKKFNFDPDYVFQR